MIITGIGDEAGASIEAQIRAHQALGWTHLELRLVNDQNVAGALPDAEFDATVRALETHGMQVAGFASAIGNWSRPIGGDFDLDRTELRRAIPRMQRLGTRFIRIMSWTGEGVPTSEWRRRAIDRCRELAAIAEDGGVVLTHENCVGWGGLSARHMLELEQAVDSPAFKLLYDIGNVISHGYDPASFFDAIRGQFAYVHVKDARRNPEGGRSQDYVYCGDGDALLEPILRTLVREDGYDGVVSIEPHVAAIVHEPGRRVSEAQKQRSYLAYGRKFDALMRRVRGTEPEPA